MPRKCTDIGNAFREKFSYTGKISKEYMGPELWNEYYKMLSKMRTASPEHKRAVAERKSLRKEETKAKIKLEDLNGCRYKKYCITPELIENFTLAKADRFIGWQLHHRLETHNSDGERRPIDITSEELRALNMYYNRPPEELIFMKTTEHRRLHTVKKKFEKFS